LGIGLALCVTRTVTRAERSLQFGVARSKRRVLCNA
jgi:hypothetical protein